MISIEAAKTKPCPKCGAEAHKPCQSANGHVRKTTHIERCFGPPQKPEKKRHRFGAYIQRTKTGGYLVIPDSYQPDDYTPEAFERELRQERNRDEGMRRFYASQGRARPAFP